MKFLAVFVALAAVAFGYPTTSVMTIPEVAAALQDPNTDPAHIPYLEEALDHLMNALYAGVDKPSVTVVFPATPETHEPDFIDVWPIQTPEHEPEHIEQPIPEAAPSTSPLVQIIVNVQQQQQDSEQSTPVDIVHEGEDSGFIDVWPIESPSEDSGHIDVWPIESPPSEEPGFIDVWPIQVPAEESDHVGAWPIPIPGVVPEHVEMPGDSAVHLPPPPVEPPMPESPLVQIIVNVQKQQMSDSIISGDAVQVVDDSMIR